MTTPTTTGSDERITPTVRALANIFWKFHNDRLDDPFITEMKPYIQPVLDMIAEAEIAARMHILRGFRRHDFVLGSMYESAVLEPLAQLQRKQGGSNEQSIN